MGKLVRIVIILAILVGAVGFYYYQRNIFSKDTLKLEILGPENIDLLQEVDYIVKYKNNGDTRLDNPELIFEYPEHALPSDGGSLRVTKNSTDLGGDIYPGQEETIHFKARLLGGEGEAQLAKATLSYQPKNLKARYTSETTFTTVIQKVSLTFEFDLPSKIESGKELTFRLNYFSNTDYPLPDLRIVLTYPSGFEFIESTPNSLDKTDWDIGLLNKAQGGRVAVSGNVQGEVGEEKIFQAKIGSWQNGEFVVLKEISKGITVAKPSLYISQQINGNPQYVANPGDRLHYAIFFKNLGDDYLSNLSLIVKLTGKAFDLQTLAAPQGSFTSGDDSIVFDWKRNSKLQFLDAGEQSEVEFWINLKDQWEIVGPGDKNPTIADDIFVSQIQEKFTNKINSQLVVSQKAFFQDEVFGNSGPLPPQVGQSTTYTVIWQAQNYYNDVKNAKIKAQLPSNVELTGKIFPEDELAKFTFDSQSREIVWDVGDLKMSEGIVGTPSPNISFQIKLTPDYSQRGQTPLIIGQAQISGQDQWTGEDITASASEVTTVLPDDKTMTGDKGIVQ